jgi:uncharacterized damage-inducible protein DinB
MACKTRLFAGGIAAAALCLSGSVAHAQGANPTIDALKTQYGIVKGYLAKTVEKVPEDVFAFKPTPEVRSFGQLVGHVADAQFGICAGAAGEKPPRADVEKTVTTKAELSKALAESTAYCDKVFAGMDDKRGMEPVKFFFPNQTRTSVLSFNVSHSFEHYGNLVTYMRLKGIVPPSSTPSQ